MGIPKISAMAAGDEAASRLDRTYLDREEFPSCRGTGATMGISAVTTSVSSDAVSKTIGPGLVVVDAPSLSAPSTCADPAFFNRAKSEFNPSPAPPISAPSFMARATPIPDESSFRTTLICSRFPWLFSDPRPWVGSHPNLARCWYENRFVSVSGLSNQTSPARRTRGGP